MKVFLGGTCNDSLWRDRLIPKLKIEYFNPVVADWSKEAQEKELEEKGKCYFHLYTLTPRMAGLYSVAEAVESAIITGNRTILCVLDDDGGIVFKPTARKSLHAIEKMISKYEGTVVYSLDEAAAIVNGGIA